MKRLGILSILTVLLAAPPAFSQASALANCKFYTKVQQDFEQGLPYCADAIKENPEDPEARFFGAWCLAEGGRLEEASESFQWLIDRKDSKDKGIKKHAKMADERVGAYYRQFFNRGIELLEGQDNEGARDEFLKATIIKPTETGAYLNLGYTQVQIGDLDGAIKSFETAVNAQPEDRTSREYYWDALSQDLNALRGEDPPDEAMIADVSAKLRETLEKILEMDPAVAQAHLQLADLDLAAGDKEHALEHMRKAIEIDAESVVNLANIGIQFYQNDEYDLAIAALDMTLEYVTDPADDIWQKATWVKGLSHYQSEQWTEALAEFEKMLAQNPDDQDVLPRAGMAARKAGDQAKGDEYLIRWEELKEKEITGE